MGLSSDFIEGMYYAICQKSPTNTELASIVSLAKSTKDALSMIRNIPKAQPYMFQFHGLSCNWMDHFLCVGQQPTPFQAHCLAFSGINRFVDVTENEQDYTTCLPETVSYYKATVSNDEANQALAIELAVKCVIEPLKSNQRVYLHCQSGFSRSAIVASVVMAIRLKISYTEAMRVVKQRRPVAQPVMELLSRQDAATVIAKFSI